MSYETVKPAGSICAYNAGWYTGSVALQKVAPYAASDQRVTVRWRVVPNGVVSHRIVPMRWPADTTAPGVHGEEDWCEGHTNDQCYSFLHWTTSTGSTGTARGGPYTIDLTQWHTMRSEKRGYTLRFFIDDMTTPVWTYTGNAQTLPTRPRVTVLQQECIITGCPTNRTGSEEIQVDFVSVDNAG